MKYSASIEVVFPCPRGQVYAALRNLDSYPLWTSGMTYISRGGLMTEGMQYQTRVAVAGRINTSNITVVRMVEDSEIRLESKSGAIKYLAVYELVARDDGGTAVHCRAEFDFNNPMLDLARPALESMARTRLRGDLETLRHIVCGD